MSHRRLSSAEREAYERDGFVVVPEVFPRAECDAIDEEIRRIVREQVGRTEPTALLQLGLRSPITRRVVADERLVALVEDVVFPGVAIYSAKMIPKVPGADNECHWHQDEAYYRKVVLAARRMSAWLALHDSDAGNGGVWFVPGSHRLGLQPTADRDGGICRLAIAHVPEEQARRAVCPPVPAGAVALFDSHTWHRSDANRSERVRRAFIVSYQDALAQGGFGEQWRILRPAGAPA